MAQLKRKIIKAQEGVSLGRITNNGRQFSDDETKAYTDANNGQITGWLRAGYNVDVGPNGHIKLTDQGGNDITSQHIKRPSRWDATLGKADDYNNLVKEQNALLNFKYTAPTPEKTKLRTGNGASFKYTVDDKGQYVKTNGGYSWDQGASAQNGDLMDVVNSVTNILAQKDHSNYDTSTIANWQSLLNLRDNLFGAAREDGSYDTTAYLQGLQQRIQNGTLTSDDTYYLSALGIQTPNFSQLEKDARVQAQKEAEAAAAKEREKQRAINGGFDYDIEKGTISGTYNGTDWDFGNGVYDLRGIDALKGTKYEGGYAYNGKLYTADDIMLNNNDLGRWYGSVAGGLNTALAADSDYNKQLAAYQNAGIKSLYSTDGYGTFNANNFYDTTTQGQLAELARTNNWGDFHLTSYKDAAGNPVYQIYTGDSLFNPNSKNRNGLYYTWDGNQLVETQNPNINLKLGSFNPEFGVFDETGNTVAFNTGGPNNQQSVLVDRNGNYSINGKSINKMQADYLRDSGGNLNNSQLDHAANETISFDYLKKSIDNGRYSSKADVTDMITYVKRTDLGKLLFHLAEAGLLKATQTPHGEFVYSYSDGTQLPKEIRDKIRTTAQSPSASIRLRKQGGTINWNKINKLQVGGYVPKRENIEKKSTLTETHALDGSDGGLTSAEKWQIAGAALDLAGVGASFLGPAGGIAGMGAGLLGTGSKFIGDIKKDGLDWGDAKNLAINLGMDVGALAISAIPGADNWLKGKKFVRAIKSIGAPVLKYLGTINASSALINTAKKIINGEKFTSQDLVQLAQGLSGGLVAGKQWSNQIGKSKAAAMLSKKAAEAANINLKDSTVIGNTGKSLKNSDIDDIVKNTKGDTAEIKKAILKKAGLDENTEIDLEAMGIKKNKQNVWQRIRKKESTTSSYEQPKEQKGNSALHYFFNKNEREQALGAGKSWFSKEHENLIKNLSAEEYSKMINDPKAWKGYTAEGAVRRAARDYSDKFGFKLKDEGRNIQLNKLRKYRVWDPETPANPTTSTASATSTTSATPSPSRQQMDEFFKNLSKNRIFNFYNSPAGYYKGRRFLLNQFKKNFQRDQFKDYWEALRDARKMYNWNFKQGGKIVKAENGTKLAAVESLWNDKTKSKVMDTLSTVGPLIYNLKGIRDASKLEQDSIREGAKVTRTAVDAPILAYNQSHLDRSKQEALETINNSQFATSDDQLRAAYELEKLGKRNAVEQEYGRNVSNNISTYNEYANKVRHANNVANAEVADANRQQAISASVALNKSKIDTLENINKNINQVWYQERQKDQQRKGIQKQIAQTEIDRQYQDDKQALLNTLKSQYEADTNASKGTFDNWLYTDTGYKAYQELQESQMWKDLLQQYKEKTYRNMMQHMKSGGKLNATEKMALDTNKATLKAIQKSSEQLFKLIQKLLK